MRSLAITFCAVLSLGCTREQAQSVSDALRDACDVIAAQRRDQLAASDSERLLALAKDACKNPRLARHQICEDVNDYRAVGIGVETFLTLTRMACLVVGEEAITGVMKQ